MKLLFCSKCHDIIKLVKEPRTCLCGASSAFYLEDGINAIYKGQAIPIGFVNPTFAKAVRVEEQDKNNNNKKILGHRFDAFVIPFNSPNIRME